MGSVMMAEDTMRNTVPTVGRPRPEPWWMGPQLYRMQGGSTVEKGSVATHCPPPKSCSRSSSRLMV